MQENNKSNSNHPKPANRFHKFYKRWWRFGLLILGAAIIVAITYKSIAFVSPRMQFLTSSLLLFFTLIAIAYQAFIYNKQAGYMRDQLAEMDKLYNASNKQVGIMQGQLEAMENGLAETKKIVEQNARLTIASESQKDTMQVQLDIMRNTIAENRRIFYVGERAYIGIVQIRASLIPANGQKPTIQIEIINGGRTPAWNVRMRIRMNIEDPTEDKSREYLETAEHNETQEIARIILPSRGVNIPVEAGFSVTHQMSIEVMGLSKFFVRGEFYFTDISESEQSWPFCFVWIPHTVFFKDCRRDEKRRDNENP